MESHEQRFGQLVDAVLDGDTVDWAAAEREDGAVGRLTEHLKIVAKVGSAHREAAASGPSSTQENPALLDVWGHLRIRERIGRGAFGDVYRAWDPKLEREVALKLIPVAGDDSAASIIREGRLLARVRHPNVVTIYGADQTDQHVGLWMEFVPGRTLEEMLRAGTRFAPAEVTRIGIELCRALSAVHAAGLLHRDIKAQNVMRSDDGRVVLMDFGTGREVADAGSDVSGTPLYLAPEVLQGQAATPQSDIYGLGVLLHHLLTGSYPFSGKSIGELRLAHERCARTDLRSTRRAIPARLARLVERAAHPRPEKRYATVDTLCADLSRAMRPTTVRRQLLVAAISTAILAVVLWLGARTIDEREPGWLATAYQWLFSASSATATTGIDVPAQVEKSLERLAVPAVDAAAPERDAPSRPARTGEDVRKASMAPGASARKAGEGLTRLTDDDTRSSSVARAVSAQQVGDDLRRLTVPDADLPENCQRPTGAFQPSNPAIVTDPTDLGFLHASIFGPLPGEPDELSPLPTSKRGKELAGAMAVRGADVEVGYAAWYREAGGSPEIGVFAIRLKTPSATEPRTDLAQRRGMPNAPTGTLTKGSVVILYWSDAHATTPDLGCIDVVRRHLESIDLN